MTRRSSRARRGVALLCISAAGAGCAGDSPTGGQAGVPQVLAYDQLYTGVLGSSADTAELRFPARFGDQFVVTLGAQNDPPLAVDVYEPTTGARVASALSSRLGVDGLSGTPPVLADEATYRLRVSAATPSASGPFQLRVVRFSRGPESVPAELPLGTWVDAESLDYESDVDTFTFTAPEQEPVAIEVQQTSSHHGSLNLALIAQEPVPVNLRTFTAARADQDFSAGSSGILNLTPGQRFTVLVVTSSPGSRSWDSYAGSYRIRLRPLP